MHNTALVTGASSGLGRDFSHIHAERGGDLVIVARRGEALRELKRELESKHGVDVVCITADLTDEAAPQRIYDQLRGENIEVDILINNAGFGGHGKFHERDWSDDKAMIQLNIMALCELTHLYLGEMVRREGGKILNVASMAAFLPGPLQAVYYATKAFVLSFSNAIAEEVADKNITVTALCPGAVETGFASAANVEDVDAFKSADSSRKVAEIGYSAMLKGKLVVTNKWSYTLLKDWLIPFAPKRMLLKMSRKAMEK